MERNFDVWKKWKALKKESFSGCLPLQDNVIAIVVYPAVTLLNFGGSRLGHFTLGIWITLDHFHDGR